MEKNNIKKIGLLGLTFSDPNKGCEALTYTFLNILRSIYKDQKVEIVCIWNSNDYGQIPDYFPEFTFKSYLLNVYSFSSWLGAYKTIKKCDCIFDASYGDGFTGIYGKRRNFVQALRKQLVYWAKKPLYLLPQTYGKYKFPFKKWSIKLINNATFAYARDNTAKSFGGKIGVTSDMAFGLQYEKSKYEMCNNEMRIGINLSSLLWDESTVKRFGLTVDYQSFYVNLIDYLITNHYEIHIIPHVIDIKKYNSSENDVRIVDILKRKYGNKIIAAPSFKNAIEAKSYISNMSIFIGSRMHSTIGAISSGVVTIPFSYAHKFEALYSAINYPYVISATQLSTVDALNLAKEWINTPLPLKLSGKDAVSIANAKLVDFEENLRKSLYEKSLI